MNFRKTVSLILSAACVLGMLCFGTTAEVSEAMTADLIEYAAGSYLGLAEWCDGYFSEGASPSMAAIYQKCMWYVPGVCGEYLVEETEYGYGIYEIPAEVYENELVFTFFAKNDAVLEVLHSSEYYMTDKAEPYYRIEVGGGFGDYLPTPVTYGFTVRDNGLVEGYLYLVSLYNTDDWSEYVPAEDETEGEDYLVIGTTKYDYNEETGEITEYFGLFPAKIVGGLNCVIDPDYDEFNYIYHSYVSADPDSFPAAGLTLADRETASGYVGGAIVEIDRDTLGDGAFILGRCYYEEDDEFSRISEIMKEYGKVASVHELTAEKDGQTIQPEKPVPVTFELSNEFSPDVTVYYIADDGSVKALETTVEKNSIDHFMLQAKVTLEHFSKYAVVGTLYGDSNEDGKVNLGDASNILKSIAKWDVEINSLASDVNGDGKVALNDVSLILKYIAKWDVWFGMDRK